MVPAVAATPTASCYSNKLQVSLTGPDHPAISTPVTYTATVANGVAPFTYTWTVDNVRQASTGSQLSYTFTTRGPHTVKVTVTDKSTPTQTDSATKWIYV
jgi:PKD repeat protein